MILKIKLMKARIEKQTDEVITLDIEPDKPAIEVTTHFRENTPAIERRRVYVGNYGKIKE